MFSVHNIEDEQNENIGLCSTQLGIFRCNVEFPHNSEFPLYLIFTLNSEFPFQLVNSHSSRKSYSTQKFPLNLEFSHLTQNSHLIWNPHLTQNFSLNSEFLLNLGSPLNSEIPTQLGISTFQGFKQENTPWLTCREPNTKMKASVLTFIPTWKLEHTEVEKLQAPTSHFRDKQNAAHCS